MSEAGQGTRRAGGAGKIHLPPRIDAPGLRSG